MIFVDILIFLGGCFLFTSFIYLIFGETLNNRSDRKFVEKIAKIKLSSQNIKEIESFAYDNADYLSDKTLNKLVSRIEVLRADETIMNYLNENEDEVEIDLNSNYLTK